MSPETITSDDVDALIRKAEIERGRHVGRRELLVATMYRVALAFIDLESIRPKLTNSKINLAFRVDQRGIAQPKAEITVPTD